MCEFFHIPFQSGDNDILRQMKCARAGARCCCPLARQHAALRAARGALLAGSLPQSSNRQACACTGQKRRSRGVTALCLPILSSCEAFCTRAEYGRAVAARAGMLGPQACWLCLVLRAVSGFQPEALTALLSCWHPSVMDAQPTTQACLPRQARLHAPALPAHHREHPASHARRQRQRRRHRRLPRRARLFWLGPGGGVPLLDARSSAAWRGAQSTPTAAPAAHPARRARGACEPRQRGRLRGPAHGRATARLPRGEGRARRAPARPSAGLRVLRARLAPRGAACRTPSIRRLRAAAQARRRSSSRPPATWCARWASTASTPPPTRRARPRRPPSGTTRRAGGAAAAAARPAALPAACGFCARRRTWTPPGGAGPAGGLCSENTHAAWAGPLHKRSSRVPGSCDEAPAVGPRRALGCTAPGCAARASCSKGVQLGGGGAMAGGGARRWPTW